ncbi:putative ribonuclease H-like domain-containing protein [Tanacetum coccineum]
MERALVLYGYTEQEDEEMDVKSVFLYGKIEEEVYVYQPLGFEDPEFPDRVYKVEKALYGLHQALRAWTTSDTERRWDFHQSRQFWETATARTLDTREVELTATIGGKVKIVTKASVKRNLQLVDSDGISSLPNTEIFLQLSLMGNMKRASKGYSGENIPLFLTMIVQGLIIQGEGSTHPVESHHTPTSVPSTSQPPISPTS